MRRQHLCEECGEVLSKDEVAISLAAYGSLLCYDHLDAD